MPSPRKTPAPNVTALRALVNARMLERGGGTIPERLTDAASIIGVTYQALRRFLDGQFVPSVELAIRLASYLDLPAGDVLHMAGHGEVAALLGSSIEPATSAYEAEVHRILRPLNHDQTEVVLSTARNIANHLRKTP